MSPRDPARSLTVDILSTAPFTRTKKFRRLTENDSYIPRKWEVKRTVAIEADEARDRDSVTLSATAAQRSSTQMADRTNIPRPVLPGRRRVYEL
jgi:hypothetical protein